MSGTTHITSASFAYPAVDSTTRARLARASASFQPDGSSFVLNTCLRTEVVVAGDAAVLAERFSAMFGDDADLGAAKIRTDQDAVEHLYRVAAGLESPVRGEREILTQFRQTLATASERGDVSGIFAKLLETAVAVARQARELLPESPHDSMAAVAAQVVGNADRIAVLGSGAMASAVVDALLGLPAPPDVTVVARTPDRVTNPAVSVWHFDRALEAVEHFPALISATSAKRRLVESGPMEEAIGRRSTPLTLIDMAMPPDFSLSSSSLLTYLDIDDLARMAERRPRHDGADDMVRTAAAEAYRAFVDHHQVGPVIGGLTRRADSVVDEVVQRFGGRLSDTEDLAVLRQTAHTVARTLLAGPISYLKDPERAAEAVDVVADAFGVDE
ncbi:MAG: hypothetical protein R3246_08305 [Acidimicrobiia bacterium]|nr:hypothetical protein [Acidimicrobiia bacterium]